MSEQKNESIQIEQLKNDLEKAANTLKLLPRNHMDKPMGMRSAWPDFAQNQIRMASERQIVLQPSAKEIDHLEKFLNHMMELTESERIIVWIRANRLPWSFLQKKLNRSRSHLTFV